MMKKILSTILFCVLALSSMAGPARLEKNKYGATQLIVDGKPYLMIAGELHNSSNSTTVYMNGLWQSLKNLNLNTVLAPIAWEQLEPQEDRFDFTLIDNLIDGARRNRLKVVVLWFGSWKNGESSYAPSWVKTDTKKYRRVVNAEGKEIETLSPFCEATMKADAKAFRRLMRHIAEMDSDGTVIAVQPENEIGLFAGKDFSPIAGKYYESQVPQVLITYMKKNIKRLRPYLRDAWVANGSKTSGTWNEVFGDGYQAKHYCTTWQYATYADFVAQAGKEELPVPTFCNCWIVQSEGDLPGVYPNGGPVSLVFDIWKAAAPHVDILCPDIYLPQFKDIVADYHRHDNPLLIPEATVNPGNAFYAFGEHNALCYSPFGIEDADGNYCFAQSYKVLNELMPLIVRHQGSDNIRGFLPAEGETEATVRMGDYHLRVCFDSPQSYGMVIQEAPGEFVVAGIGLKVLVSSVNDKKTGYIREVWEGGYDNDGQWTPTRLLNGDETWHHSQLLVKGRRTLTNDVGQGGTFMNATSADEIFVYSPEAKKAIWTPGIYKMTVYTR